MLLDVDRHYRDAAAAGRLPRIAPRRFNPTGCAWLPVLHTERDHWQFTVVFSNTGRAHELGKTDDWVIVYFHDDTHPEGQRTVVTETSGRLAGRRVIRGRESECWAVYGISESSRGMDAKCNGFGGLVWHVPKPASPRSRLAGEAAEAAMIARELMTPDPLTVSPQATVAEVWDLMREADIRHVPVVEADGLVGMVSDRDLARVDIARLLRAEGAGALQDELAMPVVRLMNPVVIAVGPEADVGEVIELLITHRIGAVPVMQEETRQVLGIISYVDVLRAVQGMLEED